MKQLHIDFETRSLADLKDVGLDNYARDPSTEVWCMAWAFDDEPVSLWPVDDYLLDVHQHVAEGGIVVGHNVAFELAIWNNVMAPRYGWPALKPEQCLCTMSMAYAMSLPGSLENAAAAVGLTNGKDMKGHRLMLQMSRPRRVEPDGTPIWWDDEARKQKLFDYCKQDVEVERELSKRLMPLSEQEQAVWLLDYQINQEGVYVDIPAIKAAIKIVEKEQHRLDAEIRRVTDGAVGACTEAVALTRWITGLGIELSGVAKSDVVELLGRAELPSAVHKALKLRQEAAKSSTAKLYAMGEAASITDYRIRGLFQYHGAGTGRWAGRKVQLQNLPRPSMKQDAIDAVLDALPQGISAEDIDCFYGPPMTVVADCLRGFITAAPGHELIAADFSAIEARVIAWLAGEEKVLDIFRTHGKIYEHAAAGIYGKKMETVTKDERQIGKVAVLALGYQGGVGAFQTMARGYGVKVSDTRADEIKSAWRDIHPKIVAYWYALEAAALNAVRYTGDTFTAGAKGREVKFKKKGSFLWCLLPSGRMLCYPYAKVVEGKFGNDALQYKSVNGLTRKWVDTDSYGGKLCENVTQAVARDLLAEAMLRLSQSGYKIVSHVHDEIVIEAPLQSVTVETIEQLMSEAPAWAAGLPLAAEGWAGKRYRK